MTFLDEYRATPRAASTASEEDAGAAVVQDWLTSRPEAMFEDLREHEPTFISGRMAFVTRFADVVEVLERNDVFSVAPYGEAMKRLNRGPNFLLGMDDGPDYRRELSILQRAFHRDDVERIERIVAARAGELLRPALAEGRLDLTDGFGRLVPTLFVGDYFGVTGPDPATLMRWARAIFTDAFVNVLRIPFLSKEAMQAGDEFRAWLDERIAAVKVRRERGGEPDDDVLNRLIALQAGEPQLSDGRIRDNLLWTVAGMIDNVNTGVASAMNFFLDHGEVFAGAVQAATAHDTALVRKHVFEALRFRTPTPVVNRLSVLEHTLSRGTRHEKRIPAGSRVFVAMGSAMMDKTALDRPKEFHLERPADHYLHFGAGVHRCLGRHIAEAHLTHIVGRLLALPGLRRAKGPAGHLSYAGPFPKKFVVEFEPSGMPA